MEKRILIGGKWSQSGETFEVRSPFTGDVIASVFTADEHLSSAAIASAVTAREPMRKLPRYEVANGLRKIAAGIEQRKDEFARTIALESAKPIVYAKGEVERAAATFQWAAGEAERLVGDSVAMDTQPSGRGKRGWTIWQPKGVIYGITPFNFPLNLVAHKVAPALAARNSIIIKPSPRTPLTALLLGEVFLESGLPVSAFQVVPTAVKHLRSVFDDERVAMISFTGSSEVGWEIKKRIGKKSLALELGGNAPVIADTTADLKSALPKLVTGAFAYSGQVCISVQRLYLQDAIYDSWSEAIIDEAQKLRPGDPLETDTRLSVMIDEASAIRTEKLVNDAVANGARVLTGGRRSGSMFEPTILTGTDPEMRIVSDEAFAPILIIEKFDTVSGAIAIANQSRYGLQAGFFSKDSDAINGAIENLDYGGVIVNDVPTFRVDNMPYGGVKDSGLGREGVRYAMEEMSELKLVVADG
ncbi:MAG: aldehyde dehydrogenase family protein [Pyrinomonadaceae bacterium]